MARARATPGWQIALIALTSTVIGVTMIAVLYWAQAVLIPVALAVFFTFLLTPLVAYLNRFGLGRMPAVLVVVIAAVAIVGGLSWLVGIQAKSLASEAPAYTQNIVDKIKSLRSFMRGQDTKRLEKMIDQVSDELMSQPDGGRDGQPGKASRAETPRQVIVVPDSPPWLIGLPSVLSHLIEDLGGLILALVLLIFMLARREDLRNRLILLAGDGRITATTKALDEVGQRISHYLLLQLIVNGAFGLAITLGLLLIGVPYALLWGFLGFALRYVPYIGPWIAALPPTLLGVIMFAGWVQPILVIALFAVVELVAGNVVEPRLYGRSIGVSEVALLVAAAFWAFLWGPIGLVLSNPITVCLVVLGKYVPHLQFLDILLGDEPVLSVDVAFYQRLVAHDRKEAAELARKHIAATSLQRIYDDVLAPAIAYARRDREREYLSEEDAEFVLQATQEIMLELAAHDHATGADEAHAEADAAVPVRIRVVASPARDRADLLALAMLRELLDPARWEVELTAVETLTAELVDYVADERPDVICIGSLAPGGLAQTRYLCKRLRSRLPEIKILVGRWGFKSVAESHRMQLQKSGASLVAASLLETRRQLLSLRPVLLSDVSLKKAAADRADDGLLARTNSLERIPPAAPAAEIEHAVG